LIKTNGFRALMRFLRPAYLSLTDRPGEIVAIKKFSTVFAASTLEDKDFNIRDYPPGTGGEAALVRRLLADSGLQR
ncbi:MAG: hypothetical protein QOC70_1904, partial [Verrucomicrobiota bacterium]